MKPLKIKQFSFLYFFLIIGLNTILYGQESAVLIKSNMYPFKGWNGSHGGHHIITVGSKELDITSNLTAQNVIQYDLLFIDDEENPNFINCKGFTFGNNTGDCSVGDDTNFPYNIPYNKSNFNESYFEGCIGESEIYGIHLAATVGNTPCINDIITLALGWNWQYSYNGINWTNFAVQFQEKRTISFKINELIDYTGKNKIYFRTGYGTKFTKFIQYNIIGCSPELAVDPPVTSPTKCKNEASGSVTLEFKTPLKDGDKFLFNIWDAGGVPTSKFVNKNEINNNKYTWTGLAEGNYTMKYQAQAINNLGNEVGLSAVSTAPFTIGSQPLLTFTTTPTQPLCSNNKGSIQITANGGTAPYKYSHVLNNITLDTDVAFNPSTTINNLAAGNHIITVSDKENCIISSQTETINPTPPAITITGTPIDATGFGMNNGTITLDPPTGGITDGKGPYTYSWTKNTAGYAGNVTSLSNLTPGEYTVTVKENGFCPTTKNFPITEPPVLTPNISGNTLISCFNGTRTLTASATGGFLNTTGNYTYSWDITYFDALKETKIGKTVTGKAGTYVLTVSDNATPVNKKSTSVTVNQNPLLTSSKNITNVKCNGDPTGAVTLTLDGGTNNYNVAWENSTSTSLTRTGLTKGTYNYTVTDVNVAGCSITGSATITEPSLALVINQTNQTQPSSPTAQDGAITVIATGGTGSYTYIVKKGTVTTNYTSSPIVNLGNGTYEVLVKDANGCLSTKKTVVLEALNVSLVSSNNIKCHSDATGSITVSAKGGTLITNTSYKYKWFKNGSGIIGQTSPTINGLAFGDYYVEITDDKTTIQSSTYKLTEPTNPLLVTSSPAQQHNQTCSDKQDGAIEITITGGTAGYTYTWSNTKTTKDITGLSAGTYSVTVTDANTCTKTLSGIVITKPSSITFPTETITKVSIFGQSTGAITFAQDPTGGNGGYTYNWTSSTDASFTPKTTKPISGLKAGYYTLEIKDSKSCSISKTFEVKESLPLTVNINESSPIKCNGDANGAIEAVVAGGVTNYGFQWFKNGLPFGNNSFKQTGLGFGDYKVTVTDFVGAKTSAVFTLKQPNSLTVTATSQTNVLCHNANTGAIEISINGGTAPYTQQWTKNGTNYSIDEDLINLGAGNYQVTVTDAVGHNCTAALPNPITITQPTVPLTITDNEVNNLTGFETLNGSIKVTISGGTTSYKYSFGNLSNVDIVGSELTLDKLAIGTYTLSIKDKNGCLVSKDYTLLQPNKLIIDTIKQTVSITCNGDKTASLLATVSGGRPIGMLDADKSYIYNWFEITDLTNPVSTSNPATGLGAGIYRLIVSDGTDNFKNTATYTDITIIEPLPIALTYTKTDAACKGENNGTIKINTTGGSGNYNIIWSYNPSVNNNKTSISDLSKGEYNVRVIDKNDINCFKDFTILINEPENAMGFNPSTIVNASGFGLSNGSITLDITGGRPPYAYKWYKGDTVDSAKLISNSTKTIDSLEAGFYTTLVEDTNPFGNNCIIVKTFEIKQPEELTISVAPTIAYCNNGKGSLLAIANGGSEIDELQSERIYSYTLFDVNDNPLQNLSGNKVNFTALVSGNYKVVATDSKNNKTVPFLVTLDQPTPIEVTLTKTENVTCFNGNDGSLSINVKGGTPLIENSIPVYTYEWKKDGIAITMNNNLSPFSLKSGNYSVKVFDGNYNSNDPNFCIGTLENIIITQPADFGFNLDKIVPTIPTAKSAFDGALHIEIVGGVAPYTYVCTDSNNAVIETKTNIQNKQVDFLSLTTDNYTIAVTDATGCTKSTTFDFNNNVLTISTTQSNQVTCNNGTNAELNALVAGGFGVKTISWYKNNLIIPNEASSTLSNLGIGSYYAVVKDFNKVEVTSNPIIVTQPNAINVTTTQKEISCSGFNDGNINLSAIGGSNTFQYRFRISGNQYSNWIPFEKITTATISNLKAATYNIQIQDNKGCNYTSNLDITLSEPAQLKITKSIITPTTGFNVANGSIAISVQGGNGGYFYKWFDSSNTQLNQTSSTLTNVLAGKYYSIITDSKGCQFTSPLFEVTQPDKLLVNISLFNSVLCNGDKNASLKTTTTGGIAGYTFQWFNSISPNSIGSGTTLATIGAGTYYVIVTDSKNNTTKSASFIVSEPAILKNTLSSEYTRCGDDKDWTITTSPTGGTAPFSYTWNTTASTTSLQNVNPANYSVLVTDNNGCSISKNITITAPIHLATAKKITKPTCFEGSDATIVLTSSGGQGPYAYLWNTGEKSNVLSNASAKVYSVAVTDFKGCVINKTYTIENPPKDVISLGEDVTLCFDQSLTINSTIADDKAKYSWTSTKGYTNDKPIITISEPADYTLVVTNKLGCKATDTVKISSQNTAISAEFAASSQVFLNEKFIIVDISNPIADGIEWVLPAEATIVNKTKDFAELSFSKIGEYELTLNTKKGNCTATQTKNIVVVEGEYVDPDSTDLKKKFDLKIYPNPSNGIFTVDVTLDKVMPAHVKVYNLTNNLIIDSKHEEGKDAYKFNFSLSGLTPGVYFVLVESQQGNQLRKIIIN